MMHEDKRPYKKIQNKTTQINTTGSGLVLVGACVLEVLF